MIQLASAIERRMPEPCSPVVLDRQAVGIFGHDAALEFSASRSFGQIGGCLCLDGHEWRVRRSHHMQKGIPHEKVKRDHDGDRITGQTEENGRSACRS